MSACKRSSASPRHSKNPGGCRSRRRDTVLGRTRLRPIRRRSPPGRVGFRAEGGVGSATPESTTRRPALTAATTRFDETLDFLNLGGAHCTPVCCQPRAWTPLYAQRSLVSGRRWDASQSLRGLAVPVRLTARLPASESQPVAVPAVPAASSSVQPPRQSAPIADRGPVSWRSRR